MNNNSESLLAVLKREPEQTSFLLKFGLGGPVVIVVADWLASTFLPAVAVVPILLALLVAYSAVLVLLVARLVHSADRWKVESADTATRLMANRRRASQRPAEPAAAQPLMASGVEEPPMDDPGADPPPAAQPYEEPMVAEPEVIEPPPVAPEPSFHQHYFFLRLETEVQDARRDGRQMSLASLDVTLPGRALTRETIEKVSMELAQIAANHVKTISRPLSVGPTEFLLSLPHASQDDAKAFVSKVVQALGNYWCHFGIAVYPKDATDASSLIDRAREACEESRRDGTQKPPKVAAMA